MVSSLKTLLGAIAFCLLSLTTFAEDAVFQVEKADGTFGQYRLLPVVHEPEHEQTVQLRLNEEKVSAPLPATYQIPSRYLSSVQDQGSRSTCAYFATLAAMETHYLRAGRRTKLSEECLAGVRNWMYDQGGNYRGRDKPSFRPDANGDFPISIVMTIMQNGVPVAGRYSSASCVYNGSNPRGSAVSLANYQNSVASSPNPRSAYGKGEDFYHNTNPTIGTIKSLIANNIPVVVGILVYQRFSSTSSWIYDPQKDTSNRLTGGHAVMLMGYTTQNNKTVFLFKNSWGRSWGQRGYGTLDEGLLIKSWSYQSNFDFITSLY